MDGYLILNCRVFESGKACQNKRLKKILVKKPRVFNTSEALGLRKSKGLKILCGSLVATDQMIRHFYEPQQWRPFSRAHLSTLLNSNSAGTVVVFRLPQKHTRRSPACSILKNAHYAG